jgi:nitric oxide reductase NorD protein
LQAYLLGMSGLSVEVETRPRPQGPLDGPPARPVVARAMLALPDDYTADYTAVYTATDTADRACWLRAAAAHAAAHLLYSPAAQTAGSLKPLALTVISLLEDARVETLLGLRYPGLWTLWRRLHTATPADGLGCAALLARLSRALADPLYRDDSFWVDKARRLFDTQRANLHDPAAFRSIAAMLANDLGQMRVQFDLAGYAAEPAYRDDHSYLWDYGADGADHAALQQSVALQTQAGGAHANEPDRMDAAPATEMAQTVTATEMPLWAAQRSVSYPEWDERTETLRPDWCTLLEKAAPTDRVAGLQTQPASGPRLARTGERELNRSIRLRRQAQGERFDLDALIDSLAGRHHGGYLDDRVFERPGTRLRTASLLLLLDVSASTAQPLTGQVATVLDSEKALALRAVELAQQGTHRIAVHGFASNTRKQVHYERYLDFGMSFGHAQRQRLMAATSAWSTRFGAALRHASALIEAEPDAARVILMVTDGAPHDIDVTRDAYLVEDARLAVQQARRKGIRCFCVALDAQADSYVRRIFGVRNYLIAVDPNFLQQRMKSLFATLLQP